MNDLISRQAAIKKCQYRLYESALNNVGHECEADVVFADIAQNRIQTWLEEVPSAQPDTGLYTDGFNDGYKQAQMDAQLAQDLHNSCADTISRQAAIAALDDEITITGTANVYVVKDYVQRVLRKLRDLPSAQPELDEWCTDCKEYNKEKHCCPRWNRVIRSALEDAQPERKTGRWSGLWSEPDNEDAMHGEKLNEGDTIYLLGVEGTVRNECGAWGWGSCYYVPWDELATRMPHGNNPDFCYCDNFVSFWELKWNFDDGYDWDGVPFIRHKADAKMGVEHD